MKIKIPNQNVSFDTLTTLVRSFIRLCIKHNLWNEAKALLEDAGIKFEVSENK